MIKLTRTKKENKRFDGDYTYKTNNNFYIITNWDGSWVLELRTQKLSDTFINSFESLKTLKQYLNNKLERITMYKDNEVKENAQKQIKYHLEYDKDYLNNDLYDIHHDLFNTDYYIIGRYKAERWMENRVFEIIDVVKEYEQMNFGELTTDITEQEHLLNMYVYIVGESILEDVINDIKKG